MTLTSPQRSSSIHPVAGLLGCFVVCYGVAAVGVLLTSSAIPTWYATIAKPSFNPPNWIFAPVWTVLYGLMAVAAWRVWRTPNAGLRSGDRRHGLILFAVQLVLNGLWTPVFFHFHQVLGALITILCLWVAILLTIFRFAKVDRWATGLMVPYLLWVSFATILNFEIYRLN